MVLECTRRSRGKLVKPAHPLAGTSSRICLPVQSIQRQMKPARWTSCHLEGLMLTSGFDSHSNPFLSFHGKSLASASGLVLAGLEASLRASHMSFSRVRPDTATLGPAPSPALGDSLVGTDHSLSCLSSRSPSEERWTSRRADKGGWIYLFASLRLDSCL